MFRRKTTVLENALAAIHTYIGARSVLMTGMPNYELVDDIDRVIEFAVKVVDGELHR